MSNRLSGAVLAAVLFGLSVLLFIQTFKVRNFPGTRFGAEIWPRSILICLGALALILLVQSLRRRSAAAPIGTEEAAPRGLAQEGIALAVFGCFAAFLFLAPRLGAYLSGSLFVFAVLSILGPKSLRAALTHLCVSVGAAVTLWLLFSHVLHVLAPAGRWWALL